MIPAIISNGGGSTAAIRHVAGVIAVITATGSPSPIATITGGADASLFSINDHGDGTASLTFAGFISFLTPTDADSNGVYDVIVTETNDSGTDTQAISVTVALSAITTTVSDVDIYEKAVGQSDGFYSKIAIRIDSIQVGGSGPLVFSIGGGVDADKFEINQFSGDLSFIDTPDYETPTDNDSNNVYEVTVKLTDDYSFDTHALHVHVLDRDEVHPVWLTTPLIHGSNFVSRNVSNDGEPYTVHRLRCDDGAVTVGEIVKNWYRADDEDGTNSILAGTGDLYAVQTADAGKVVTCVVTATNGDFTADANANWLPNVYLYRAIGSALAPPILPGFLHIMPLVSAPAATPVYTVRDLSDVRQLFILTDHDLVQAGTGNPIQEMPETPHWDKTGAQADIDFGFDNVSAQLGEVTRSNTCAATLISPSYAVGAAHVGWRGGQLEFMQPDETVVQRTCTLVYGETVWYLGDEFGDLVVYKLDSPIETVAPIGILTDTSKVAGKLSLDCALNRSLKGQIISETQAFDEVLVEYTNVFSEDLIKGGDSGSPIITVIDGHSILMGCVQSFFGAPSVSSFIPDLSSILAEGGESLTLFDLVSQPAIAVSSLGHITSQSTGTFTPPVSTAVAVSSLGHITSQAAGTSAAAVRTATSAANLGRMVSAALGASTPPVFTATAASNLGHITSQSTGTSTPPVFTATAASHLGHMASAASGTLTTPVATANSAASVRGFNSVASGTFVSPLRTAASSQSFGDIITAAAGTFSPPVFTGAAAMRLGPLVSHSDDTVHPPLFTGTSAVTMNGLKCNMRAEQVHPGTRRRLLAFYESVWH